MQALGYIRDWYRMPARARRQLDRPRQLNFPVTDNCNARCVMCDVWRDNVDDDMTLDQIRATIAQPFFARLEHVGLSGGEPMLRKDIVAVVEAFLALPRLKSLSITSHGFNLARHRRALPLIAAACRAKGVAFSLNLSFDGVGPVHEAVRQVPGGFAKLTETLAFARSIGVPVAAQCTVSKRNLYHLADLRDFADAAKLPITYRLATDIERLYNQDVMQDAALDAGERSFFADFLQSGGVMARTRKPQRRLFYRALIAMIERGAPRRAPCYYQREGVLLSSRGELFHCSISDVKLADARTDDLAERYFSPEGRAAQQRLLRDTCATCVHDQSGAWHPARLIGETLRGRLDRGGRLGKAAKVMQLFHLGLGIAASMIPRARSRPVEPGHATIIGCYGGEHVGDAAILGGVLLRLNRTYGTDRFTVLSSRPARTRRWVADLGLPFNIQVADYSPAQVAAAARQPGYLAIGGGPIMDIPLLLLRHYAAARQFRARGRAFHIVGAGLGPFRGKASRVIAQRLLRAADSVELRAASAVELAARWGVAATRALDPAFDHLDRALQQDAIGAPTNLPRAGRPRIGLNLRPLWSRYATPGYGEDDVARIEESCVQSFAAAIAARPDLDFVFFAMNADHYGMSDFDIAARIGAAAAGASNFTVVRKELGIGEVCRLMKSCDQIVAMRFHACIFAKAMGVPLLGIDYGLGKSSKVADLLADLGDGDPAIQVEEVTLDRLLDALPQRAAAIASA